MNPRITRIVEVKPYTITVEWTNGEIKSIDFNRMLMRDRTVDSIFSKLFQKEIFLQVKTDGRTLYWDGMAKMTEVDGTDITAPIDFCPDVLYDYSE